MTGKKYKIVLAAVGIIVLLFLIRPKKKEVERIESPGKTYCAIILKWKSLLGGDFNYEVLLAKNGQKSDFYPPVFVGSNIGSNGLYVTWDGNKVLNIAYDEGDIEDFSSVWFDFDTKENLFPGTEIRLIQPFLRKLLNDPNNLKSTTAK